MDGKQKKKGRNVDAVKVKLFLELFPISSPEASKMSVFSLSLSGLSSVLCGALRWGNGDQFSPLTALIGMKIIHGVVADSCGNILACEAAAHATAHAPFHFFHSICFIVRLFLSISFYLSFLAFLLLYILYMSGHYTGVF